MAQQDDPTVRCTDWEGMEAWEVLCWGPSPEALSKAVIELLHHNKIP